MNSEQLFGSAMFVPCVVHEYSRKHVLFAQMVGEWLLLYEYILMQTKIFLGEPECLRIHH